MADLEKLRANLEARGFRTAYFPTADEAAAYLDGQIDGKTVGIGGSMTVKEMGLYPRLAAHNQVVWHWEGGALRDAVLTDVYITSANALAETGEIVNIDGNANRLALLLHGPKHVCVIAGMNKVVADVESGIKRVHTVACPLNAARLHTNTPCELTGVCANCHAEGCMCCQEVITRHSRHEGRIHVILVGEDLGY